MQTQSIYQKERDAFKYRQMSNRCDVMQTQYATLNTLHCKKDPSMDFAKYYCKVAQSIAYKSTCIDKQVGCVITDEHNNILSTGYNGNPSGYTHCTNLGCCLKKEGKVCLAIHAEINAIIKCPDIRAIRNVYLTLSPCLECLKVILNTGCTHVYYSHLSKQSKIWQEQNVRTVLQNRQHKAPLILTQVSIL